MVTSFTIFSHFSGDETNVHKYFEDTRDSITTQGMLPLILWMLADSFHHGRDTIISLPITIPTIYFSQVSLVQEQLYSVYSFSYNCNDNSSFQNLLTAVY